MFISFLGVFVGVESDVGPSALALDMGSIAVDDLPLHVLFLNKGFKLFRKTT